MKRVIGLIALMGLTACGNASFQAVKYTCSIDGPQIVCPDGTSADLPEDGNDGVDGVNGIDGQDGTQVKIIDPCGDGPGVDEVVMVFGDGTDRKSTRLNSSHGYISYAVFCLKKKKKKKREKKKKKRVAIT